MKSEGRRIIKRSWTIKLLKQLVRKMALLESQTRSVVRVNVTVRAIMTLMTVPWNQTRSLEAAKEEDADVQIVAGTTKTKNATR